MRLLRRRQEFAGNNVGAAPVVFDHVNRLDDRRWRRRREQHADRPARLLRSARLDRHHGRGQLPRPHLLRRLEPGPAAGAARQRRRSRSSTTSSSTAPGRSAGSPASSPTTSVVEAGHQWMVPGDHAYVHRQHSSVGGAERPPAVITGYYDISARIENNTFDGLLRLDGALPGDQLADGRGPPALRRVLLGFPDPATAVVDRQGRTDLTPHYDGFFEPAESAPHRRPRPRPDLAAAAHLDRPDVRRAAADRHLRREQGRRLAAPAPGQRNPLLLPGPYTPAPGSPCPRSRPRATRGGAGRVDLGAIARRHPRPARRPSFGGLRRVATRPRHGAAVLRPRRRADRRPRRQLLGSPQPTGSVSKAKKPRCHRDRVHGHKPRVCRKRKHRRPSTADEAPTRRRPPADPFSTDAGAARTGWEAAANTRTTPVTAAIANYRTKRST